MKFLSIIDQDNIERFAFCNNKLSPWAFAKEFFSDTLWWHERDDVIKGHWYLKDRKT